MYHYVTVEVVMRDCKSVEDVIQKCERLLPYKPDENCTYMESWEIVQVTPALDSEDKMTDEEKINWVHCLLQEVWNKNIPTQEEVETALGFLEDVRENVS